MAFCFPFGTHLKLGELDASGVKPMITRSFRPHPGFANQNSRAIPRQKITFHIILGFISLTYGRVVADSPLQLDLSRR